MQRDRDREKSGGAHGKEKKKRSTCPHLSSLQSSSAPDPDRALKDAGGCALAVAVLSAFVRLPDVAAHPTAVGLAPALVKVSSFVLFSKSETNPASKVESCAPVC